ncbi:hypothetical protein H2201_007892 [Coniosporium apollinis]|uniref:Amino acid transporter transmembrane domain-containing protein n=1 Tax=Coniosporium apollinis TaxID=61459 RepID=A0ABQ9NHJ0_9PEZI|nr:hypothetical protein H2201_007892 [Coniosporium apollinis]
MSDTFSSELERAEKQASQPKDAASLDPFGSEVGAAIAYKTCSWWHVGALMVAETISLGVLGLPHAVAMLGLVPGILLIVFLGLYATYTGYVIGQFRNKFPAVANWADAAGIVAGPWAYEIIGLASILLIVFIMAAHVLSFSIMMNVLTDHATCSIAFAVMGLVVCFVGGLPRTWKNISYTSIVSCLSVVFAVGIALVGIAVAKLPDAGHIDIINYESSLQIKVMALMTIILAYAGHVAFFSFISELREPRDFPKALFFMQTVSTTFYCLMGAIIYYYAGPTVLSPALGSASPIVRKVAYGIAAPTIVVAGVVNGHVACKQIYLRVWKGTDVVHQKSFKAIGSWVGICAAVWTLSWVIAEAIPAFDAMLALIGALFCGWFSYGFSGVLWIYMNKGKWWVSKRKGCLTVLNSTIFLCGAFICGVGLWATGTELAAGHGGKSFSCADNYHPSN